jgi:serine phosphatase RsbU (regulator of sigma subunit)
MFYADVNGVSGACMIEPAGAYAVIVFLPDGEIYAERNKMTVLLLGGLLCLFLLMYVNISSLVQKSVVHKIQNVNESLLQIQNGNLEEKVSVASNTEFVELSDGINATVNALKETIKEVAERMNQEMEFARQIQQSVLPVAEHVQPKNNEYEILGTMDAAKEVGGDFFDYFLIGDNRLAVVIADVSGKGVPAALFMMTAKTLIKNFVLGGKSPAEALELANIQLCENNEAGMFVTVWLGILDYSTCELEFANAGHNPPLLKKGSAPFVYMDHKTYKRSIVLGVSEAAHYTNNRLPFTKGDILYLYTDGVTEADNVKKELYGEERLKNCMENNYELPPKDLLRKIREDIDAFADEAEQFDDITMVVLKMHAEALEVTQ